MSTPAILSLDLSDVLHQTHLRRLKHYSRSDDFLRLLEAAKTGAELRRRGRLPVNFGEKEYGTEAWLKEWLIGRTSEATGRILLDVIESSEGDVQVGILIEVLSHGCLVVYL